MSGDSLVRMIISSSGVTVGVRGIGVLVGANVAGSIVSVGIWVSVGERGEVGFKVVEIGEQAVTATKIIKRITVSRIFIVSFMRSSKARWKQNWVWDPFLLLI